MKNLNILILSVALVATQACGPKPDANNPASNTPAESTVVPTAAERRAKLETLRAAQAEKRRIAFEERVKSTPYYKDTHGVVIYNKAEVDPSFIGGNEAMMTYLNDNIVFPKEAEENGLEATIFVDFVIGANGNVRDVEVTETPGEESDPSFRAEAIRVVSAMPKWVAGHQNGKPVDVKYSLPVTFQIL